MKLPYPYKAYKKVSDIFPETLAQMGIKAILLDIDGTLMQTREICPADEVMNWIKSVQESGIIIYILSNNKHPERVKGFAESIGCQWNYLSRKPFKKGFINAASKLGFQHAEIAVVGDQIFTDMLGARLCGMKGLIVDSLDTYLWYYWPRHIFELLFWKEKE